MRIGSFYSMWLGLLCVYSNTSTQLIVYIAIECYDRHHRCAEFKANYPGWFNDRCAENTPNEFVGDILMRVACPVSCGDDQNKSCDNWKTGDWFQGWCKSCDTHNYFGGVRLNSACPKSCICGN